MFCEPDGDENDEEFDDEVDERQVNVIRKVMMAPK